MRKSLKKQILIVLKNDWQLYVFLILPFIFELIFEYAPMAGLYMAFSNYNPRDGIFGSRWVGLNNLLRFINTYQFKQVVSNTLILSLMGMFWNTILPIFFALTMHVIERPRFKKVTQTICNMPHFISMVVLVGMMKQIFGSRAGLYGSIYLKLFGEYPSDLFGQLNAFRPMYLWSGVWQNLGWKSIIYTAALAGVDLHLHEAAEIDGASRLQRIWHIDLAHIKPTIIMLTIMSAGSIMNIGFQKAYLMQNPLNLEKSELISTYVYRVGLSGQERSDFSYATAIGLFNSVVNWILLLITNFISRKLSGTSLF